jgi:lipid-binding SYLF domain-containing protein
MYRYVLIGAIVAIGAGPVSALPPSNAMTLEHATEVLNELSGIPLKGIPPKLLAEAKGVAIIPRVVKAGFVVGGRGGHGVVFARNRDGRWGDPVFINLGGASVGFQAGVESTDVVLLFRNHESLKRLLEGKGKITLGADASISAGPVGRDAMAATDAKLEGEILSYSRSRGLFAGVALDGAVIRTDQASTAMALTSPTDMKAAELVRGKLMDMSHERRLPGPVIGAPPVPGPVIGAPPVPGPVIGQPVPGPVISQPVPGSVIGPPAPGPVPVPVRP